MSSRELDVVVYGATGYVGTLTALYLAQNAPDGVKIGIAGRNQSKLEATRAELAATAPRAAQWPIIIADADAPSTLDALCARTRVVCTTVGPYLRYGEPLVAAAATAGTDYVDLTGEAPFVRRCIDKYGETAQQSGARIVNSCGFDSIPSDYGAFLLDEAAHAADAGDLAETTMVIKMRGGISGGTVDSVRVLADMSSSDRELRRQLVDPRLLNAAPGEYRFTSPKAEPSDLAIVDAKQVDPQLSGHLAPFFMATHNTRVVRRSATIAEYGPAFRYRETMYVGKTALLSTAIAGVVTAGIVGGIGAFAIKPIRPIVDRLTPKPGQGPSEKSREKGWFVADTYTTTTTGARFKARVGAKGDPGYKATAVMLGESALSLALGGDQLPKRSGVLTPSTAMGNVLADRLRQAGFTLTTARR